MGSRKKKRPLGEPCGEKEDVMIIRLLSEFFWPLLLAKNHPSHHDEVDIQAL
ncbi:MAG: hypothetical protein UW81_C0020G0007 [Candidatus Giovannonibacteria bacterium GW2011_GWC2_44_9]|uniref:Uncharacterized protein n=1 Tax=Candidatus Giovannonibacteria bacterium GW2011_GWC2_44_9 TaxID=1618658 RepID=A0A0G1KIJ4_9BACT|nr:MAG: hypothetical protein UW81_C0020G0007 [Candidatus Giovannonibacteria bacterium GW2011_GWC2_44_9]